MQRGTKPPSVSSAGAALATQSAFENQQQLELSWLSKKKRKKNGTFISEAALCRLEQQSPVFDPDMDQSAEELEAEKADGGEHKAAGSNLDRLAALDEELGKHAGGDLELITPTAQPGTPEAACPPSSEITVESRPGAALPV